MGVCSVSWSLMLVAPRRNQRSSLRIASKRTFLVVTIGKPSRRSYFFWTPKTEMVPVPVRSVLVSPFSRTSLIRSRYCFILFGGFGSVDVVVDAVGVLDDAGADGSGLALVFAAVWLGGGFVEVGEDDLAHAFAGLEFYREGAGVVEFEGDAAFEAGVDEAGVLDEEANTADGAAAFDEGDDVVGDFEIFLGGGEEEGFGGDGDGVAGDFAVFDFVVKVDDVHLVFFEDEEMVAEAAIDGGGLNGFFVDWFADDGAFFDKVAEGLVGDDHGGFAKKCCVGTSEKCALRCQLRRSFLSV